MPIFVPAYYRDTVRSFLKLPTEAVVGILQQQYANDGFKSIYTSQTTAWADLIPKLREELAQVCAGRSEAFEWSVLVEYPLHRLRRRIDIVLLAGSIIVVIECKVGATTFLTQDCHQAEEYALDLRDFHAASSAARIVPILWATNAQEQAVSYPSPDLPGVAPLARAGATGLGRLISRIVGRSGARIVAEDWDRSPYRPVPGVIQAATTIFAGHDVREIANADAENLSVASGRVLELVYEARDLGRRYLIFLTGVPGAGKTLAGLHVVHSAELLDHGRKADVVYLSGNSPLITVLREALARDRHAQMRFGTRKLSLGAIRRDVRTLIQHINDFLKQGVHEAAAPNEHAIVFDEAQRAWDSEQGQKKFGRAASEPALVLEIMGRHRDWCACVCLIGGGQEINSGEEGVAGWGDALRAMTPADRSQWTVFGPHDTLLGGAYPSALSLGKIDDAKLRVEPDLQLTVPQRTFRSPRLSDWVDAVLSGEPDEAGRIARQLERYPLVVTRTLESGRQWLRGMGRGERRYGLLASSGARRLRADGLGAILHPAAGDEISHWYLNSPGDIRSSFALEVPANQFTAQGLELDFACLCWGGDLLWDDTTRRWTPARLSGDKWKRIRDQNATRFVLNSYRVLLTRAREGTVIWVPRGDAADSTREPAALDATAAYLISCGAKEFAD